MSRLQSERMHPRRRSVGYCIRKPLLDWLASQSVTGLRLLDVGCGDRPYEPLFADAGEIVGFDLPGNEFADLHGDIDALPVEDAAFDVVLCVQVLEHVPDPASAVRELRRVVRPGGRVLASTHGVYPYHPVPEDYWRWTLTGLERLFADNASWSSITVTPACGTAATLSMLVAHFVDLWFKRAHIRPLGRPLVAGLNVAGELLDQAVPLLRRNVPGALNANYHVEAVA